MKDERGGKIYSGLRERREKQRERQKKGYVKEGGNRTPAFITHIIARVLRYFVEREKKACGW